MKAAAALALLAAACSGPAPWPDTERGPDEDAARELAWPALGGEDAPPAVVWWYGGCPGDDSGKTAVVVEGVCYAGLFRPPERVDVAWRGAYSRSGYAHEMMHRVQWQRGVSDPDHLVAEDWGLVREVNADLADAGL